MDTSGGNRETILELCLPFLHIDELFQNLAFVSKGIHLRCMAALEQHCHKHHPIMVVLKEMNATTENVDESEERPAWLSYCRYRSFLQTEAEARRRPGPATPPVPSVWSTDDYELVYELSTTELQPKLLVYGIQALSHDIHNYEDGTSLSSGSFPSHEEDDLTSTNHLVRVFIRQVHSGLMALIMNQTTTVHDSELPLIAMHTTETDYINLLQDCDGVFGYATTFHVPNGDQIGAWLSFGRKISSGNLVDFWGRPLHINMFFSASFDIGVPAEHEDLLSTMNTWFWF